MCQAIPKKVISIKDNVAIVECSEGNFRVSVLENNVKAGDYLLIYGNVALYKVSAQEREINPRMIHKLKEKL